LFIVFTFPAVEMSERWFETSRQKMHYVRRFALGRGSAGNPNPVNNQLQ